MTSGNIMSRTSLRTIMFKSWKEYSFWVRQAPCILYLFRNNEDFNMWRDNPLLTQKERDYLVKFKVDFEEDARPSTVRGFNVTEIKCKVYEKGKPPLHQFKLEQVFDYGPSILAAFASPSEEEANALHAALKDLIILGREALKADAVRTHHTAARQSGGGVFDGGGGW